MDHRIHLGLRDSPELPPRNDFIAKPLFFGTIFDPKKVPGPKCRPGDPKSNPGLNKSLLPGPLPIPLVGHARQGTYAGFLLAMKVEAWVATSEVQLTAAFPFLNAGFPF